MRPILAPAAPRRGGPRRRRGLKRLAALAAFAFALSGCINAAKQGVSPASAIDAESGLPVWVKNAIAGGEEHDHNDPAQHANTTTPNFHVLGWDPMITQRYGATGSAGCGGTGTTKEGRKLAASPAPGELGFTVADVTDPAAPKYLGEYLMPNIVIWDVTVTPDGKHVLVGGYSLAFPRRDPTLPPIPGAIGTDSANGAWISWRDACTGETTAVRGAEQYLPFGPGIVMVGIADPKNPELEDWVSQPIGPHSVGAHLIDGKIIATASVTNLVHEPSYYTLFEVADTPLGKAKLVPLSVIRAPGVATDPTRGVGGLLTNGHVDIYIAKHPKTNKTTAWLANWNGMYTYDLSDLRDPKPLGEWHDGKAGSVHTTYPLPTMWGQKHYTIVGQEVGEPTDLPSGWVYVVDDTDPAHPKEVGRWTLPLKVPWGDKNNKGGGLAFSPHYVAVVDKTLFVTNYHGGIWAVDISDPTHPDAIGHFYPTHVSPKPLGGKPGADSIEDVIADPVTGDLVTWGAASGVYVLHFDEAAPMAKPVRWAFGYPA